MLRILTYHRIAEPGAEPDLDPSLASATPETFARHAAHLARHYQPVTLAQVLRAVTEREALPGRAVLLTFDDAYRDFQEVAWPILRRHGLPATLFVPTAYPDHPERTFWWDRLYASVAHSKRAAVDTPLGPLPLGAPDSRRASLRRMQAHLKSLPHDAAMAALEALCAELNAGAPPEPGRRDTVLVPTAAARGVPPAEHPPLRSASREGTRSRSA